MKKTYEKPEMQIELFKLDDVIMESSAGDQQSGGLTTVGNGNETEELFFTP